ncbi:MAG TPA: 23S rRNA (uracil(1939)-C(5))-methyltransferase RlmD [Chitinophagaceae bacterium]|nr:23S rRNA (uracil(1939)-C(5))-methyltransferase RlmD [Chitinophagaceae bacterium]
MRRKKFVINDLPITDYASEGKSLGRIEGKVIFADGAVPGDVVDIFITKNKKDWAEGKAINFKEYSKERVQPFCIHFGICGGCKWQMLPYEKQLQYKQQEAEQVLKRIGKVELPGILPIIGSDKTVHYRNKLEFTFSNRRYLTSEEINKSEQIPQENALGYHAPGIFDKIIDIKECWLLDDINNLIRNAIREYAIENNLSYYDIKEHKGFLRNIILRYCTTGELMINMVFGHDDEISIKKLLDYLLEKFPAITTLLYTINPKWNDSIYDLAPQVYSGKGYITEVLGEFQFKISPKSFFQTNTKQAEKLYEVAKNFASLTGNEVVYDLYCGTGSLGIFLSKQSKKIIGVDVIEESIKDAKENALLNNIQHAHFFSGDVIVICNESFFAEHGKPDIVITDPPRAGMHEKLILKLLEIASPKIVYVSCNVATQARDINLLSEKYSVEKIQPLDMFPHTHHIECVVLLKLKQ